MCVTSLNVLLCLSNSQTSQHVQLKQTKAANPHIGKAAIRKCLEKGKLSYASLSVDGVLTVLMKIVMYVSCYSVNEDSGQLSHMRPELCGSLLP